MSNTKQRRPSHPADMASTRTDMQGPIRPASSRITPEADTRVDVTSPLVTHVAPDDRRIAGDIADIFVNDPRVDTKAIRLGCEDGHVRVEGVVPDREILNDVTQKMAHVSGVVELDNRLRVV